MAREVAEEDRSQFGEELAGHPDKTGRVFASSCLPLSWLLGACLIAALVSCDRSPVPLPSTTDRAVLRGAGATFPAPLYEAWFQQYAQENPGLKIEYDAVGSGEGERRFMGLDPPLADEERVDFAASDAALANTRWEAVPAGAVLVPMTGGSLVLAFNLPDVQGELKLSRDAYSRIFLGEITRWDDAAIAASNPDLKLPRLDIVTVTRQDSSGTTFAFTNHLSAVSQHWRDKFGARKIVDWPGTAMKAAGNEGVAGRIQQSVGSIGYLQYGYAKRLDLQLAVLENRAGNYIAPTDQSGQATLDAISLPENLRAFSPDPPGSESYPIVTLSWILLYQRYDDAAASASVKELFSWCLTSGQAMAAEYGYLPLPEKVVARSLAAVRSVEP